MKSIILPLIVLCILACKDKKQRRENNADTIHAKHLLQIIRDSSFQNWHLLAVFYLALAVSLMYILGDLEHKDSTRCNAHSVL